jgi:predicted dienelactone hydrolase
MYRSLVSVLMVSSLAATAALAYASDIPAAPISTKVLVAGESQLCDGVLIDDSRNRSLPLRVRLPQHSDEGRVPAIIFSHGLGGSIEGGTAWGEAWAKAGFAVIHVQHPGSDRSVWEAEKTPEARRAALQRVDFPKQLFARIADIKFVAGKIGKQHRIGDCSLAELDPDRIGGAGHSFGAHTMLALAGQQFELMGASRSFPEPKIKAFVVFSPSAPQNDPAKAADAYGKIKRPVMSVTGTKDAQPFSPNVSPATRLAVYAGMPDGGKVQLLFDEADHMTFNGGDLIRQRLPNDDHVWPIVQSMTTTFFKAKLLADAQAEAALGPEVAKAVIGPKDRYEVK